MEEESVSHAPNKIYQSLLVVISLFTGVVDNEWSVVRTESI